MPLLSRVTRFLRPSVLTTFLTTASTLTAQTGTVTGRVTSEANEPLSGAQVQLLGTGLGTRTAENGRYTIVNVPAAQ